MQPPRTVGNVREGQTDDQMRILESELRILEIEGQKREREFNELLKDLLRLQPDTLSPGPERTSVTNIRTWMMECMRSLQSVTQRSQPLEPLRTSAMLSHASISKADSLNGLSFPKSASFKASARSCIAPGNIWSLESSLFLRCTLPLYLTAEFYNDRRKCSFTDCPFFLFLVRERRCPWR